MRIRLGGRGRRHQRTALLAAAALSTAALVTAAPVSAHASATATVTYQIGTDWGTGFQAQLTITPSVAVTNGWTLEFDAGDQQTLTFAGYAASSQSGRHVTLSNRSFNAAIAAGATLNLAVQFSNPSYSDVPPSGFVFNGQPAAYTPSPYIVVSDFKPTVPEGGSSAVTIRLSQAPASPVVFELLGPSAPAVTATPGRLTFSPADWNTPQTVTLSSPRDADAADQTATYQVEQISGYPTIYPGVIFLATQLDNG
jgi:hypothetical protein